MERDCHNRVNIVFFIYPAPEIKRTTLGYIAVTAYNA